MDEKKALSVVLVNYKVYRYLHLALQSLEQSMAYFDRRMAGETEALDGWTSKDFRLVPDGSPNVEVWVVDNASSDGSEALIKASFPWVQWIQNPENIGFARANNQALAQAGGKYLLIQNPDTVLSELTLWKCWQVMESDPMVGALGVRMLDGHGRFLRESKRGLPTPESAFYKLTGLAVLFPYHPRLAAYHLGHLNPESDHDVPILAGAFMWVRAQVAQEIGLLDERYFMYGEDIDWSYRILRAGYRNRYLGTNPIIHFKGESTRKESMRYVRMFYGAMMEFASRYYGPSKSFWLHIMLRIGIGGRAALSVFRRWSVWAFHPVLDWVGFMWLMQLLTLYWENHVKANAGLAYPIEFKHYVLPAYVSIWVLSAWFNGAYEKTYRYHRVIRGMIMGTLAIGFVYAFLPAEWRFSRGLILAGTGACLVFSLGFKGLVYLLMGRLESGWSPRNGSPVIGIGKKEMMHQLSSWYVTKWGTRWLGYVVPSLMQDGEGGDCLGEVNDVRELMFTFGVNEIAVDTESVPMEQVLQFMLNLSGKSPFIRFLPRGMQALIGGGEVITSDKVFGSWAVDSWPSDFQKDQRLRNRLAGVFLFILQTLQSNRLKPMYRERAVVGRLWKGSLDWLGSSKYSTIPCLFDLEEVLKRQGLKTERARQLGVSLVVMGRSRMKAWSYAVRAVSDLWVP
ncbi:MAG: glycosyltransferase [Sphingomonadales bacterium]|nr:glycosyltransferase [Sphingomonadales bacterium]